MSHNLNVVAIMLTRGQRPEYTKRAIECFHRQTYPEAKRWLLVFDPGPNMPATSTYEGLHRVVTRMEDHAAALNLTIGELRNRANTYASMYSPTRNHAGFNRPGVLIHWDDDDWSHPQRISEQVDFLVRSGADCVGYREMLFWRQKQFCACEAGRFGDSHYTGCPALKKESGEAWLYSNTNHKYAVGTSLCYWRETWERHHFPALPKAKGGTGEDTEFIRGLNVHTMLPALFPEADPMMIARIHPGNTQYYGRDLLEASSSWTRVPQWDATCRKEME